MLCTVNDARLCAARDVGIIGGASQASKGRLLVSLERVSAGDSTSKEGPVQVMLRL